MNLKGKFKEKYGENLKGNINWLQKISPEDRKVWSHAGFVSSEYGRQGGRVRAATASRDSMGRFAK